MKSIVKCNVTSVIAVHMNILYWLLVKEMSPGGGIKYSKNGEKVGDGATGYVKRSRDGSGTS